MDDTHFDALTRSLAVPSRRSLFAAIATALGAALFGDEAADDALAKSKRTKRQRAEAKRRRRDAGRDRLAAEGRKKRKKKKKKKPTATVPPPGPGTTSPPPDCTPTCAGKFCGAPDGCGGICQSGWCPGEQLCQSGRCVTVCDAGLTLCDDQCINTQRDGSHCGGCDQPCEVEDVSTCGTDGRCWDGVCLKWPQGNTCKRMRCVNASEYEYSACDGHGTCVTKTYQCFGYCDPVSDFCTCCSTHTQCGSGRWCDGCVCHSTKDPGTPCGAPEECTSGFCVAGVCCESACDASAPPNAHRTCATGICALACNPGFANCDGAWANGCEADLNTSEEHCGGCNQPCGGDNATGNCTNGTCTLICDTGWDDCDGDLANGCEADLTLPAHCGSCSNVCTGPCGGTWECIGGGCRCI